MVFLKLSDQFEIMIWLIFKKSKITIFFARISVFGKKNRNFPKYFFSGKFLQWIYWPFGSVTSCGSNEPILSKFRFKFEKLWPFQNSLKKVRLGQNLGFWNGHNFSVSKRFFFVNGSFDSLATALPQRISMISWKYRFSSVNGSQNNPKMAENP